MEEIQQQFKQIWAMDHELVSPTKRGNVCFYITQDLAQLMEIIISEDYVLDKDD